MSLKNGYVDTKSAVSGLNEGIIQPIAISFTILQVIVELSILGNLKIIYK